MRIYSVAYALTLAVFCSVSLAGSKVELRKTGGTFQLLKDGKPFQVKGVGGTTYFAELADAGGNTVRTWGADDAEKILDEAEKHGLMVCVGIWLGHERHGFDYSNSNAVKKQFDDAVAAVRRLKDHPALLMWGLGNEMEGAGDNPAIYKAVNDIAKEVKRIDPHHPTMTVIAEIGENELKAKNVEKYCPDIDILGINSYGGIPTLADRFKRAQATKPYIVTEHGPPGPWEVGKTPWGSPVEVTSTAKGKYFADGYRSAVLEQKGLCLGSFAFLWGHKQETTATWFGMLLSDGSRLAAVDAMTEAWTGVAPKNRCPAIESLTVSAAGNLKPGATIQATLKSSDPESDELTTMWYLRADSRTIGQGGDFEAAEATLADAVVGDNATATVTLPSEKGAYRLFAYVYDGQGGAATANVALEVDGRKMAKSDLPATALPYAVYTDGTTQSTFVPSGYMGNAEAVRMNLDSTENPRSGRSCLKAEYRAADNWGGVLWQSPADDWDGLKPGGANFSGATHLEFWARGAKGGETVNFVFGVLDGKQPYRDTAKGELKDVRLTSEWKKYSLPLSGKDLGRIKTCFGWSLAGQGSTVSFYLDDIRFVGTATGSAKPTSSSGMPKSELPFAVYLDGTTQDTYIPSGYMGNAQAIKMDVNSLANPKSGKSCLKVDYTATDNWGGVLWQSPADDWDGLKPGGANLTGATRLEFWARGDKGGETVNFVYGVLDGDQPFGDTAKGEMKDVKLTSEWKKYSFPLDGKDLGRIKTGFGWSLGGQGRPVTFYLDDIRYVAE